MKTDSTPASRRLLRWLAVLGTLLVVLGLVGLTPLQGPVLQAILLGPDSLVTPPPAHAMALVRDGHRLLVRVQPGIVREDLSFPSRALGGRPEPYDLYLPPGYDTPANRPRRYPVLYLLRGAVGHPGNWIHGVHVQLLEDQGMASGTLPPVIMVMPGGEADCTCGDNQAAGYSGRGVGPPAGALARATRRALGVYPRDRGRQYGHIREVPSQPLPLKQRDVALLLAGQRLVGDHGPGLAERLGQRGRAGLGDHHVGRTHQRGDIVAPAQHRSAATAERGQPSA